MFAKTIALLFFSFVAIFAIAAPAPNAQCDTGDVQCCNTVEAASSSGVGLILGLLGIVLQDLSVLVGLGCTPITVIGIGGTNCAQQPVCCTDNTFQGIINIGCSPIAL